MDNPIRAEVRQSLFEQTGDLERCLAPHRGAGERLAGELELHLELRVGAGVDPVLRSPGLRDATFRACVVERVLAWSFDPSLAGHVDVAFGVDSEQVPGVVMRPARVAVSSREHSAVQLRVEPEQTLSSVLSLLTKAAEAGHDSWDLQIGDFQTQWVQATQEHTTWLVWERDAVSLIDHGQTRFVCPASSCLDDLENTEFALLLGALATDSKRVPAIVLSPSVLDREALDLVRLAALLDRAGWDLGRGIYLQSRNHPPAPRPLDPPFWGGRQDQPLGLSPEQERAMGEAVQAHDLEIQACHQTQLGVDPEISGRLDFELVVVGGRSVDVQLVQNSTGSAALGHCVLQAMGQWELPGADGAFRYPLLLTAPGGEGALGILALHAWEIQACFALEPGAGPAKLHADARRGQARDIEVNRSSGSLAVDTCLVASVAQWDFGVGADRLLLDLHPAG